MSGNVTTALQVNATTGNGEMLTLREPRLVTFRITGNGAVSAGQITIERAAMTDTSPVPLPGSSTWSPSKKIFLANHQGAKTWRCEPRRPNH